MGYLKRLKVLRESKDHNASVRASVGGAVSSDEGESGGEGDPCELCGRRYPHEHVKSIYTTERDEAGEDEEG